MNLFDRVLSVAAEDMTIELRGLTAVPWADFLLNPRRLRGSDFLMRWSQGQWSEHRMVETVNDTSSFFAMPYGISSVAPDEVREAELYFERLDKAGLRKLKRPDLLVFRREDRDRVNEIVASVKGVEELPFLSEDDAAMREILASAAVAVECENSLWRAKQMPDYGRQLTPQKRLGGRLGLRKTAVLPTVILKDEDRRPLREWQQRHPVRIHIWHVFYDLAFGLAFDEAERLIKEGLVLATEQVFQAPSGPTTRKAIYKIYHHYAYPLADCVADPELAAAHIVDKNGHILPYVKFRGGQLKFRTEALRILEEAASRRGG